MKKTVLLCILLTLVSTHGAFGSDYESYNGFTVYSVPKLPPEETHPSLWFHKENVAALRAKKDGDALASNLWKQVSGSEFLTMSFLPIPSAGDDKTMVHTYYGSMSKIAKYAGFMIWMTDDPAQKQKWIGRATAALERAYDGPIYELDPRDKSGPTDEIYMGTWLQNYAAAYDWVQPFLSAEQDAAIRERLVKNVSWIAGHLYDWASRPHNHLSKPAWGVGSMALALSSEKDAYGWLALALAAGNDNTRYFFSADGIYREGSHYMIYSWVNFLPFMVNYYNVSGVNQFPAFQPLMEWGVEVRSARGWLPNIEDSYIRPFPGHMAAAMYRDASTRLHTSAPLADVLMWAYKTTDMTPFNKEFEESGFNYTGATWDYTLPLDEYMTYDPSIPSVKPDVSPTVFLDGGQTVFRNTWDIGNPAARVLLFQGVAEADNHQHADHLSFILSAENQMMACDAGYSRKSYSEAIRTEWYNQAEAHNVVKLAGAAPQDAAESVTPISRYRIDTSFFDFEEKEAPYPNGGLLRRAIAFPGESYFVVADIVTSPEKAEAAALLHGGRAAMSGDGNYRVWDYENDAYGSAARLHTWTFGSEEDFSVENAMGESTYLKGDYGSFPYIRAKESGTEMTFLQLLVPTAAGAKGPEVTSVRSGRQVWATVQDGDVTDTFMVQPTSAPVVFQGLETDGTFVWVREKSGKVIQYAVREATGLVCGGETLLKSEQPVTRAGEE
ncbi:MAG: heparinase II/III family protein [Kiritimatiellales bacterium]